MDTVWLWLDRATIVIALVAAVFAGLTWVKATRLVKASRTAEAKRRAPITIRLVRSAEENCLARNENCKTFDLPYKPRRDQLSRQELTGLLSFYYGEPRFDPTIVRRVLENGSLAKVLAGDDLDSGSDELLELVVDWNFFDKVENTGLARTRSVNH